MNDTTKDKLVYDCNVYLQYLISEDGPGGRCVRLALDGAVDLFLSAPILVEVRELPDRQVCIQRGIDSPKVERLIASLLAVATLVDEVPERFRHPIDQDDSCYVNLAIAVGAKLIVSRDRHLLNLTNPAKHWSAEFRKRFPSIRILDPVTFLRDYDQAHWDHERST